MSKLFKAKTHRKLEDLMKEYNTIAYNVGDQTLKIRTAELQIEDLKGKLDVLDAEYKAAKEYWAQAPEKEKVQDAPSH